MRAIFFGLVLAAATGAFAKAPTGQGKACDAKNTCASGFSKCPEDQRCVKDGAQNVCHAINDLIL